MGALHYRNALCTFFLPFRPPLSPSVNMSRIAAPLVARAASRFYTTASQGSSAADQAAMDRAARAAGFNVEKFTATQLIAYVPTTTLLTTLFERKIDVIV